MKRIVTIQDISCVGKCSLTVALPVFLGASGAFYAEPAVDILCGFASITVYALMIGRILREREITPDETIRV